MTETRAHGKFFLEKTTGKSFTEAYRMLYVLFLSFFYSMVMLKIHPTFPIRERRRGRSLHLIALYVLSKKVLEKRKASFQMLSEQRYGNVR